MALKESMYQDITDFEREERNARRLIDAAKRNHLVSQTNNMVDLLHCFV